MKADNGCWKSPAPIQRNMSFSPGRIDFEMASSIKHDQES